MSPVPELVEQARRLREIRESLGLTREEMAARLRVKFLTLKAAENGTQRLGMRTMEDAEQLAEQGVGGAEESAPYRTDQHLIQATINLAADPKVQAAARALCAALGMTEGEALAMVIREKLARG